MYPCDPEGAKFEARAYVLACRKWDVAMGASGNRPLPVTLITVILTFTLGSAAQTVGQNSSIPPQKRNGSDSSPRPGTCVSKAGRFSTYPYEGKKPQKTPKSGPDELTFCRVYKEKTCCGRAQSDVAFVSSR